MTSRLAQALSNKRKDLWTPHWLMKELREQIGLDPALDMCACKNSTVAPFYCTKSIDGLKQSWVLGGKIADVSPEMHINVAWCNPPRGNEMPWVDKAYHEIMLRHVKEVYFLVPSRHEAEWGRKLFVLASKGWFLYPRINYYDPATGNLTKGEGRSTTLYLLNHGSCSEAGYPTPMYIMPVNKPKNVYR